MKLTELFNSFQGEGLYTGHPMTFIRLAGCPVGCPFCDTDYTHGKNFKLSAILASITHPHVCVTGGEPLVHPDINELLEAILRRRLVRKIHIETSGCYEFPPIVWKARKLFWITISPKGSFLGAKKNFIPNLLYDANEVKWIVPSTPHELIMDNLDKCLYNYIQPVNSKFILDDASLAEASQLAQELNLPLSLQVHKLVDWR